MKNTLILFFFILVITFQINAQDLTRSYSLYLPAIAAENKEYHEQISASLQHYARLNPDLIYYYIKYLDARFNQKISNLDSNYYNDLLAREKELVPERNSWISRQKSDAWDYVNSWIEYRKIASLYNEFEANRTEMKEAKISPLMDEQLKDYFIHLYLSLPNHINFDKTADYKELITSRSKAIVTSLTVAYENARSLTNSEKDSIINLAMLYPFLLDNYYSKISEQNTDFELYELIDKLYLEDYEIQNEISVDFMNQLGVIKAEEKLFSRPERFPFIIAPLNYNLKVEARNNLIGGIGFKLKLNAKKSFLSYVKLGIYYGIGTTIEDKTDIPPVRYLETFGQGKSYRGNIYAEEMVFSDTRFIQLTMSIPVIYIFKYFYAEVGFNYSNFNAEYSVTMRRDENPVEFTSNNPVDHDTSPITRTHKKTESQFWPFVSLNYIFFDRINLRALYIGPRTINLGLDVIAYRF